MLGLSATLQLLTVVHCYRQADTVIRLIPARRATRAERAQYAGPLAWRDSMRREYDFSKARRNPYASKLKRSVTIRPDEATIAYFKQLAAETEIPYQTLINLYLRECAGTGRRLTLEWRRKAPRKGAA